MVVYNKLAVLYNFSNTNNGKNGI